MTPRKNKPIVQVQGYAMRFKKMNKNGTELFYCVERERRARCDSAYHFDRMNNSFTVKNQHARHDEDFVRSEVNRNRKLTNALKDGRLIKTLINQPIPPIMPFTGLNLLDTISDAHSV
ncbi:Protein CBG04587 [Caenorhabditis briggsae]|uniref:Protein CBG04587 n=1 Tax=Caenorhabditis briggsae TaxID=6238 RepID=A8WY00_CAEBR|nr:Protein CBG04587 [Caenorhabditis briggsae]CAP25260.1 Protein CBG04587 [Caenorhabditis briggsae]